MGTNKIERLFRCKSDAKGHLTAVSNTSPQVRATIAWRLRQDSNLRHLVPETSALSPELRRHGPVWRPEERLPHRRATSFRPGMDDGAYVSILMQERAPRADTLGQ